MSLWKALAYRTLAMAATMVRRGADMGSTVTIFMFHGIYRDETNALVSTSSRSVSDLREGLRAIRRKYEIMSIDEAVELVERGEHIARDAVVITFDDSLRCLAEVAAPVLMELDVPATFYLSTDILDSGIHYWWQRLEYAVHHATQEGCSVRVGDRNFDVSARQVSLYDIKAALRASEAAEQQAVVSYIERELGVNLASGSHPFPCAEPMTWKDAEQLLAMGMTVGSHTVSHCNVNLLDDEVLEREVTLSKRTLEEKLGIKCEHFCYPYGIYGPHARAAVEKAGYRSAVIVGRGGQGRSPTDLYTLPRLSMAPQVWKAPYQVSGQDEAILRFRSSVETRFRGSIGA